MIMHNSETTPLFGKLSLADRVVDCPYKADFDLRPLLSHFGEDATWRDILVADRQEILSIPGFASKTVNKLYAFTSDHVQYGFADLID